MKSILIVARGSEVARLSYDSKVNTSKTAVFEAVAGDNTRANALAVVNHSLRQLKESGCAKGDIVTIYTVGLVSDMVANGTFKYWIREGKKNDGSPVEDVELGLWKEFAELYQEMFLNINIKNISTLKLPERSKFKPTKEQMILDKLVAKAWELIQAPAEPQFEESEAL